MPHWKLTLAYDGTDFAGWQIQPGHATVQGALAEALRGLTSEEVLPQGSGRTDAGVHALAQVASFSSAVELPAANLQRALNRALPASIRVLQACRVDPAFHARHSAVRKTYEYRIFEQRARSATQTLGATEAICPPFLSRYVWACPWALHPDLMNHAATALLGTHDFTSFAAADPDRAARMAAAASTVPAGSAETALTAPTNVRTLEAAAFERADGVLRLRVTGSGFLHHMVRNVVGTLVDVGRGQLPVDNVPAILAACDRRAAGPTAPACGLFLHSVEYAGADRAIAERGVAEQASDTSSTGVHAAAHRADFDVAQPGQRP